MASTPAPRSGNAVPLRAPLRGQGPAVAPRPEDQPAAKPDFAALARKRMGQTPPAGGPPPAMRPMSGPPVPAAPAPAQGGRGYTPPTPPVRADNQPQQHGYANPRLNDPSIREAALKQLAEKQKAAALGRMQGAAAGMVPGRGDGGMVRDTSMGYSATMPQSSIDKQTQGTTPQMSEAEAAANKAKVDAAKAEQAKLHDKTKPIFGMFWDEKSGQWQPETGDSALPPGVDENTPGVYYDPEMNMWTYDPEGGADKAAIDAQVEKVLTSSAEDYGMSPELLAENMANLDRQGAEAKSKLSQQLAGRGIGASGLAGAGLGNIDVGTQAAKTQLATDSFRIGVEARQNELKTLLTAHGNELSEQNRKAIADQIAEMDKQKLEYERLNQKEADQFTFLHDSLANLGASSWSPEAWAYAMKQIKSGMPYEEAMGLFMVDGSKRVVLNPKANKAAKTGEKKGAAPSNATYNEDGTLDTSKPPPGSGIPGDEWGSMSQTDRQAYWWFAENGIDIHAESPEGWAKKYPNQNWNKLDPQQQANFWKKYYYQTVGG